MDRMENALAPSANGGAVAHSSLLSRRRKSRSHAARKKNPSTVDPASPEVISSLISSLSTISVPVQTHFDNVPRIESDNVPPSPSFLQTEFPILDPFPPPSPPPSGPGFGVTYGIPKSPGERPESPYLHPDDAAASPIIRMARAPPSPKAKNTLDPLPSPIRPTSKGSYTSARLAYEDAAFGMVTAEPIPRVSTAPSIASSSSESRRSLKGALGLLRKSSHGSIKDKEAKADRLRKASSYNDNTMRYNVPRNRASVRSMHSMADVVEEGRPASAGAEPPTAHVASAPPSRERQSLQSLPETATHAPGGVGSGRGIPPRDSSLRHSSSSAKKHPRHSRYSSTGSKETKADSGVFGTGANEAEQVNKRIQELKSQQQKIKSELETDNTPDKSIPETKETPTEPVQPVPNPSEVHQEGSVPAATPTKPEEGAPAPAVSTGTSRTMSRTGAPQPVKGTHPQPPSARQSLDKVDQLNKSRYRRSVEPSTPTKPHKRSPSGPISPGRASVGDDRPSSADSVDAAVNDYISSPKLTQKIIHPTTGRIIAFSEVGEPKGHVVLCCLGMGLTRYLMAFYDELARTLNLRLITVDRPGVGESGPYQDETGTPLGWPGEYLVCLVLVKLCS